MDWDGDKYDRGELSAHLQDLGVLDRYTVEELLVRTTKNTRTGNEFGFKPISLSIGVVAESNYYEGFSCDVDSKGENVHNNEPLPSSFWIRFKEEWFQIRCFCKGMQSLSFRPYECRIPFREVVQGGIQLRSNYIRGQDRVEVDLIIRSRRPPIFTHYLNPKLTLAVGFIYDRHATESDFFYDEVDERDAGTIEAISDRRALANPGLWLVHRLKMNISVRQYKLMWMCMVRLRLLDLFPDFSNPARPPMRTLQMPSWQHMNSDLAQQPFELRYLLEGLLTHGLVTLPEIRPLMSLISQIRLDRQLELLEGLFKWTRQGSIGHDLNEVRRRLTRSKPPEDHLVVVRRCLVAPTKCILNPPGNETSNALLRRWAPFQDRFLRVQFVGDHDSLPVTGETIRIDKELDGAEGTFARVRRALSSGLRIAGRLYVFLTFSESQVREAGCWMISELPQEGFDVASVLASMGDLTQERIIAKHAARQSLALSTTRALKIKVNLTRNFPDIERNGYTFTDGTGQCSLSVAAECARILRHQGPPVSAFQARSGGIKGVFAVVNDPSLGEWEVRARKSQTKFPSYDDGLHVLKVATYAKATLNRQAILLLEAQGVPTETLLDIFRQEKRSIEGLEDGFDPNRLSAVTTFPLSRAFRHNVSNDPFLDAIVRLVKCRLLSDLKWKAWIEIDQSAFLMGIPDETNSLAEDEVFCQIHPPGGQPRIIMGACNIYRNPLLHPGDVRLVEAVDCPALRHLRNVIVFNVRGARDLPNKLSGGDLDGDCYSLIWDTRLLIRNVHPPMDYTPPQPIRSPYPVTIEQTKQHYVNFIMNDVLGRVCNAHMVLADLHGPQIPECLDLARLASEAVDFGKTGVPVQQNGIPAIKEYPDFMGKDYKSIRVFKQQPITSYESQKALGRMFRLIDPEPVFGIVEDYADRPSGDERLLSRPLLDGDIALIKVAAVHKMRYDFDLTGLLRRYNINETECVAGLLLRSPKTRVRVEKDYEQRVAVREAYAHLVAAAMERMDAYLTEHPFGRGVKGDRRMWALAAYKLVYDPAFAHYMEVDWSQVDPDLFCDAAEEAELMDCIEEEARSDEDVNDGPALQVTRSDKRYSFAWLLREEVFAMLDECILKQY